MECPRICLKLVMNFEMARIYQKLHLSFLLLLVLFDVFPYWGSLTREVFE